MSEFRKNTLTVDFSVLPKRPDAARVEKFLEKEIQLRLSDTTSIQLNNIHNCVYIAMINVETALQYQNAHNNRHLMYCGDKGFKIPVYVEKETVTVRIHDLPPQMPHTTVVDHIQQYGTPISITRERWKNFFSGCYNGVRVVQMKLDRPIPSFITINGESTLVKYRNQPKTCRHCGRAAHPTQKCSMTPVSPNTDQAPETPGTSFASILKTKTTASDPAPTEETSNSLDSDIAKKNNYNETNTITDNSSSSSTSSTSDSTISTCTEPIVNQKRRLSGKKENDSKKTCISQQGSQIVSQSNNRFEALVALDWLSPAELILMHNKSGKGGNNCNNKK